MLRFKKGLEIISQTYKKLQKGISSVPAHKNK